MSKIALIEPPPWDIGSPNLGIAYLKSVLVADGHDVSTFLLSPYFYDDNEIKNAVVNQKRIFKRGHVFNIHFDMIWDAYIEGDKEKQKLCDAFLDKWVEKLKDSGAVIFSFSLNNLTLLTGLSLAQKLRKQMDVIGKTDYLMVAGGPSPSTLTTSLTSFFDIICIGEGEETLREIAKYYEDGSEKIETVKGTITNFNGRIQHNPPRELIKDLDILPIPDFKDIPKRKYGAIAIQTSRGCIAGCAFCDETVYWDKYRWRKPKKIVEEIELQSQKYNTTNFRFHDSLINGSPKQLERLCELLKEKNLHIIWGGNARVEGLTEELIKKMYDAGCRYLLFGIESASQRILNNMQKKITVEKIISTLEACQNVGIWTHTHWMTGFPTEQWEDVEETIRFIEKNKKLIDSASVHPFTLPTQFSHVFNNPQKFGITEIFPEKIINLFGIELTWEYGFKVAEREENHTQRATEKVEHTLKNCKIPDIIFAKSIQGRLFQIFYLYGALKYFKRWLTQY